MSSLFSPDSRIMQALSRAADLMILNLLFLLTSVPVVTIGASRAALYRVVFFMGTAREGSAAAKYFRAFCSNFKQGTLVWLLFVIVLAMLFVDLLIFSRLMLLLCIPIGCLALVALAALGYVFPLVCFFDNSVMGTVKNALILSLANLPRTVLVLVLDLLPWALMVFAPYFFFSVGFLWIVIYFSAAAYLNSWLLRSVFRQYLPEDTLKQEESL